MQNKTKWKLVGLLAATATVGSTLALTRPAQSADHRDAPKTKAEAAADINDVFTFMDGSNYVMAMTVFPFADGSAKFSDSVQYVFHTTSGSKFGESTSKSDIICTFDAAQAATCWVGSDDYVTGNASAEAGMKSASGKTKVFAGRRGDPFFFNLSGFTDTVAAVDKAKPSLTQFTAGCPTLDTATTTALGGLLKETASTADPARTNADDFVKASALVITVSVDKSLVTKGGPFVSVWASTNGK